MVDGLASIQCDSATVFGDGILASAEAAKQRAQCRMHERIGRSQLRTKRCLRKRFLELVADIQNAAQVDVTVGKPWIQRDGRASFATGIIESALGEQDSP